MFTPFEHWLEPVLGHPAGHGEVATELSLMALSVAVAVSGIGFAWLMYAGGAIRPEVFSNALGGFPHRAVYNKYWVDEIYDATIVHPIRRGPEGVLWKGVDVGVIDGFFVNGSAALVGWASAVIRRVQSGFIYHYAFMMIIGVLALLTLWFARA